MILTTTMTRARAGLLALLGGLGALGMGCFGRTAHELTEGGLEERCMEEMVEIRTPDDAFCIDRYEATLFADRDCAGSLRFNESDDDLPSTFPDNVESEGCQEPAGCQGIATVAATSEVFACSVGGILPSGNVTWFQAKRACENMGKRLCTVQEWQTACGGPDATTYPYGDTYDGSACNGDDAGFGGPINAGSVTSCEGGYPDSFDFSGNLREWAMDCVGGACRLMGGSAGSDAAGLACGFNDSSDPLVIGWSDGIRCCAPLTQIDGN